MVRIDLEYQGDLRCAATHGPSGTTLATDAPVDNQGRGESFSPTDLLATALGSCMLTIMGIVARRHGIDLIGAKCSVVKEMTATPPRRVAKLAVEFTIPAKVSVDDRQRLVNAAETCPVHRSLLPDIDMPITFHWGE